MENLVLGTREHRPVFLTLWREYLKEQYDKGGPYLATNDNLLYFLAMYDAYDTGSLFGGTRFIYDSERCIGLLMGGEDYPNGCAIETRWGKVATVWGVYIIPEYRRKGVGLKLILAAQQHAKDLGFDTMVSHITSSMKEAVANADSYPGMERHGFIVTVNLEEV